MGFIPVYFHSRLKVKYNAVYPYFYKALLADLLKELSVVALSRFYDWSKNTDFFTFVIL